MLEQQTFEVVIDEDYRYFENMWDYMDSGISAEIVSVEYEEEDEYDVIPNRNHHGQVLVLLKSLMIKVNKPGSDILTKVVDAVSSRVLENQYNKELDKERKMARERRIREKAKARVKREIIFRFACNNSVDLEMKVNMLRFWLTSMNMNEVSEDKHLCLCILFSLAIEFV